MLKKSFFFFLVLTKHIETKVWKSSQDEKKSGQFKTTMIIVLMTMANIYWVMTMCQALVLMAQIYGPTESLPDSLKVEWEIPPKSPVGEWQSWYSNLGSLIPEPMLFTVIGALAAMVSLNYSSICSTTLETDKYKLSWLSVSFQNVVSLHLTHPTVIFSITSFFW